MAVFYGTGTMVVIRDDDPITPATDYQSESAVAKTTASTPDEFWKASPNRSRA
jgi:hypothetical protein